ncbi:hypothetical protein [Promicromonospora soli]
MTTTPSSAPRPPRTARLVLVGLVVVGLALLAAAVWAQSRTPSSGWFAYAPLSETTYTPAGAPPLGTAALLSGAGALLLGGAAGFVIGRRTGAR